MSDLRWLCRPLFGLVLTLTVSCGIDQNTLATIGGRQVEIVPFQTYVGEVTGEAWQAVSARVTSRLLDQYLDRQVVLEAARSRDVNLSHISSEMGPSEVQWLLDELCGPAPEPSEAEISTEVGRKAEETRPARAHVRQLLLDSHELGLEALQRLSVGEDFVEVSRQLSRAPNASDGGELGFFDHGSLPPEIDEVIFSLAPGEYSEPVQGPSGYHVFQILEVVPEGPPDLAEVEAGVRTVFAQKMVREHIQRCIGGLASEVGVEIYDKHLWFPYTGRYAEEQ
ncbi:MAG: peptidylprolyl isomerase [Acidobacteria bacterium]|uniref:Peptidylprolyl isomerase n=1 Tax=Candidatus Sulfomarinibacter kjeldsenii TaxID=2885994 RepID=A0A8J6Y6J4_9BACT|nr:peptidylprolyl isomerase [Candidatus Sulfomarinibacter kjeldsenii]